MKIDSPHPYRFLMPIPSNTRSLPLRVMPDSMVKPNIRTCEIIRERNILGWAKTTLHGCSFHHNLTIVWPKVERGENKT